MKIGLVAGSFLPVVGGAEFVVHNLASQWTGQGHDVCVFNTVSEELAPEFGAHYRMRKYSVIRGSDKFGAHRFPFRQFTARNLKRQLDNFSPDYISAHFGYPVAVWLSSVKPAYRYHVTCHGRELTKFSWGYRATYNADEVIVDALNKSIGAIAISRHAQELMIEMGVPAGKILQIPNGIDVDRFQTKSHFNCRSHLGISEDATIVLSVGREHPQKAFDTGILAFAQAAAKNPDLVYVILGQNTKKWQPLVDQHGLNERIILCDGLHGDQLVAAYQQSDIFFSPSIWEMMPLVVLEAMASGLPLVVTNISGSQDLVASGENGYVVEPDDVTEMASKILQLAGDGALRERMSLENRSRSLHYSWENVSRQYLSAYDKAVTSHH